MPRIKWYHHHGPVRPMRRMSLSLSRIILSVLAVLGTTFLGSAETMGHVILDAPNGGEVVQAGADLTIEWRIAIAHNLLNWDLWYSTTGPSGPWIVIAEDLPAGSAAEGSVHTYDWVVPNPPSTQVRVRVRMDNSVFDYEDISSGDFTIEGCTDTDADGFGSPGHSSCPNGPADDCDDFDGSIHPDATEICNGLDDDCDGTLDNGFGDVDVDGYGDPCDNCPSNSNPDQADTDVDGVGDVCDNCPSISNTGQTDADGDGFGAACDCNDAEFSINPNTVWYEDADGDGFGNPTPTLVQCQQPAGYVADSTDNCPNTSNASQTDADGDGFGAACDCDDTDVLINPNTVWYEDADGDGFGSPTPILVQCQQPTGYVADSTDNCLSTFNPDQVDADSNGVGDVCECACDCHADPQCDGQPDVFDIVHAVDVGFRNGPDLSDPNPLCQYNRTDVDCDSDTDVFDVVHLVAVAFRNEDPALHFCEPCAP